MTCSETLTLNAAGGVDPVHVAQYQRTRYAFSTFKEYALNVCACKRSSFIRLGHDAHFSSAPSSASMPVSHRYTFGLALPTMKYCKIACHRRGGTHIQWRMLNPRPCADGSTTTSGGTCNGGIDESSTYNEGKSVPLVSGELETLRGGECECLIMDTQNEPGHPKEGQVTHGLEKCDWKPNQEIIPAKGNFDSDFEFF
jgi:hypothetical protein